MIVILAACSGKSQVANSFVNSPCQVPCWQNITPGVTKAEDTSDLLKTIPGINESKIERLPRWNIYDERYKFSFRDKKSEGEIFIIEGSVYSIAIYGDLNIPLEQIIQLYGEPEKLIVSSTMVPGLLGLEGIVLEVYLVYLKKGSAFSFYNSNLDLISIKPNNLIKNAIFSEPKNILNIISPNEQPLEELERQRRAFDWKGYQDIKYDPKN
jgi:hypothetical protein